MRLEQWLKNPGADQHEPILDHAPSIGIHDTRAIEHVRTYLWDLDDYHVSSVQAGVIWLVPRRLPKRSAHQSASQSMTGMGDKDAVRFEVGQVGECLDESEIERERRTR